MNKTNKDEIVNVIADLKAKGYSYEELAVALDKSHQTVWNWGNPKNQRVPSKSDFGVLKHLLTNKK